MSPWQLVPMLACLIFTGAACTAQQAVGQTVRETEAPMERPPVVAAPLITPPQRPLLAVWWADHETGDLSQWDVDGDGGVFNTGTGHVSITSEVAHTGSYAAKLEIHDASRQPQAVRLFRWGETQANRETFASAWYFFPRTYVPKQWWNIFQFKSKPARAPDSLPAWTLNVGNRSDGQMFLYLWDAIREKGYTQSIVNLPEGSWVHIEARYVRSTKRDGRIAVWQDGLQLWDLQNVQTAFSNDVYWSVNNYTDDVTPNDAVIFVDDAVISRGRIGP